MAVVYRARHRATGRWVALKISRGDPEQTGRDRELLRREGRKLQELSHPNIVKIIERGQHRGRPFFSMEWLAGGSLADRLGHVPLPIATAVAVIEQVARGIAHAHRQRILHRDLRPSNILFTESGIPKVIDFGLAKRLTLSDCRTRVGPLTSDPRYMAPEWQNNQNAIGVPADVHALGAILYHILAGRPPFEDLCWDKRIRLKRLQLRPPSAFRPEVPARLDRVCLRCLKVDPDQRYQRVEELHELLA
jgi:serine/threonine-protein kinase